MKVACAVLTWNVYATGRADLFRATLESIREPGWPVYLIDNGSTDQTADLVRRLGGWRNPGPNLTIGAGVNVAVAAALSSGADLVVFSNDDILWRPGWAEELLAFWNEAPDNVGICGGLLERKVWSWNTPIAGHTWGGVDVLERETVPGGAWTFRSAVWPDLGPIPDENNAWSDVPACHKMRRLGYRLVCADWTDHLAEYQSTWGNGSHAYGEPLNLAQWGLQDRRAAAQLAPGAAAVAAAPPTSTEGTG